MTDRISQDRDRIRRYLEGDVDAFDELMRANEDRVFAICLRMMKDRDAALDATQDVFLTVFRKTDRYKEQAAFSTWVYRVAANTCYDPLRRLKRQRTESMPGHLDPSDPKGGDEFNAVELRPELLRESRECRLNIRAEFDGIELVATLRVGRIEAVSYTHLRAHETVLDLV